MDASASNSACISSMHRPNKHHLFPFFAVSSVASVGGRTISFVARHCANCFDCLLIEAARCMAWIGALSDRGWLADGRTSSKAAATAYVDTTRNEATQSCTGQLESLHWQHRCAAASPPIDASRPGQCVCVSLQYGRSLINNGQMYTQGRKK